MLLSKMYMKKYFPPFGVEYFHNLTILFWHYKFQIEKVYPSC